MPGANAFAADTTNEIIAFEEYYMEIKSEYAKYGINYEILQHNDSVILTKGMLEKQLILARQQGENQNNQNNNQETVKNLKNNIGPSRIMPVTYSLINKHTLQSPCGFGSAEFAVEINVTENIERNYFMSLNSKKCYQDGAYLNFKSWKQESITHIFDSNGIAVKVKGKLKVEYKEPNTGFVVGYTSDHEILSIFYPE